MSVVLHKDVLLLIAKELLRQSFFSEVVRLTWICATWRRHLVNCQELWTDLLLELAGTTENFPVPERDFYLDALVGNYPLSFVKPCVACVPCVDAFATEPLVDLRPFVVVFLRCEAELVRRAAANVAVNDASRIWSEREVFEWETRNGIVFPRLFRQLYRWTWSGGSFANGIFQLWSLDEIAKKETPIHTVRNIVSAAVDDNVVACVGASNIHGIHSRSITVRAKNEKETLRFTLFLVV